MKDKTTQNRVLQYIKEFMLCRGYSPSVREIMNGAELKSTSSVNYHMMNLRDKGLIDFIDSQPRTITVKGIEYREVEE